MGDLIISLPLGDVRENRQQTHVFTTIDLIGTLREKKGDMNILWVVLFI